MMPCTVSFSISGTPRGWLGGSTAGVAVANAAGIGHRRKFEPSMIAKIDGTSVTA